jgi:hypothetical protein
MKKGENVADELMLVLEDIYTKIEKLDAKVDHSHRIHKTSHRRSPYSLTGKSVVEKLRDKKCQTRKR